MTDSPPPAPQKKPLDELSLLKLLVIGFGALWICEKIHEGIPPFGGFPFDLLAGYERRWTPPVVAWLATYLVLYLRRKLRAPLESGFTKLAAFESGFAHRMVGAVHHSAAPASPSAPAAAIPEAPHAIAPAAAPAPIAAPPVVAPAEAAPHA